MAEWCHHIEVSAAPVSSATFTSATKHHQCPHCVLPPVTHRGRSHPSSGDNTRAFTAAQSYCKTTLQHP